MNFSDHTLHLLEKTSSYMNTAIIIQKNKNILQIQVKVLKLSIKFSQRINKVDFF